MKLFDRLDRFEPELKCSIIGTTAALIGAGIASAAGGVASSAIGASAAGNAANAQAAAADRASQLQYELGKEGLALQREQYNNTQAQQLPFLQGGQASFANLLNLLGLPVQGNLYQGGQINATQGTVDPSAIQGQYGSQSFNDLINSGNPNISPNAQTTQMWQSMGVPFTNIKSSDGRDVAIRTDSVNGPAVHAPSAVGSATGNEVPLSSLVNQNLGATGSLMQPFGETWQAPTAVTEQNDPGYQFRLSEGMKALERSAAARGDILSGGTAKGLQRYGQDYASNEFGNVYNRALTDYTTRYNAYNQNQANQFNRLASILGVGQQSSSQLQGAGQNYANSGTTILNNVGQEVGNNMQNAAAARASGYVGAGNAWGSGISNAGSNIGQLLLLSQLMHP